MKSLKIMVVTPGRMFCMALALTVCMLLAGGPLMAQGLQNAPQGVETEPDPAENRAAFLNFVQGSLESGFMDEWRGRRPMKSMEDIGEYLQNFNVWGLACHDAQEFGLNAQETQLLTAFRKKAELVQAEAFPKLRDAFGPVLRQLIKNAAAGGPQEVVITARTVGQGFRTAEFISEVFRDAENITALHDQVKIPLGQLRFTKADYKTTRDGAVLRSFNVGSLKDSDIVIWLDDNEYLLVK